MSIAKRNLELDVLEQVSGGNSWTLSITADGSVYNAIKNNIDSVAYNPETGTTSFNYTADGGVLQALDAAVDRNGK